MSKPFHPCLYLAEPDSQYSEWIRSLRNKILTFWRKQYKSFLVASSWEGEGKSTVCINLAASMAEIGMRPLLVDGDLRQRSLTRLLLQEVPPDDPVPQPTPWIPGVQVLGAAPCRPSEAANRLGEGSLQSRWRSFFQDHNLILVDSPPMSVCGDAFILGRQLDGALMVVSEDKFVGLPEGHFSEDLRDQGIELLGTVITGVRR
jgi:Mrp family chromosome partitioning ATPase